jgi:hypothetical protein
MALVIPWRGAIPRTSVPPGGVRPPQRPDRRLPRPVPRGASRSDPALAARWDDEAEAAEVRDRLNSTEVRGGERLLDDGWMLVPLEWGRGGATGGSTGQARPCPSIAGLKSQAHRL